jgi:hypothetical protein
MLEHPRLRIGAIEQGNLMARNAVALEFGDLLDDEARLVDVRIGFENADRFAGAGLGPQVLALGGRGSV